MQTFRSLRFFIFMFFFCSVGSQTLRAQNYQLVWSDEFNGTTIDMGKWSFDTGGSGWGNNEKEYYTNRPANAYLENGSLVIKAIKENYLGNEYTSARLKTQGKASWTYGKIEARLKLPYGQGIWPAFWMLGENISTVSWPRCGEIDIMEMIGGAGSRDRTTYGTLHWDNSGHAQSGGSKTMASGRFADDYHVFSIIWNAQKIIWYLDGVQYYQIDITPSGLAAFHKNQFIILNLAVGGSWPGYPDGTTEFPQTMMVDYVRVYQDVIPTATVTLTAPSNNVTVAAHSDIVLTAEAKVGTGGGSIAKVEFFQDAMKIGEALTAPYSFTLKDVFPGYYHFAAKATTSTGESAVSSASAVFVDGAADTAPYGATAASVPGTIEMENYDLGDAGWAYHDADAGNSGNVYRSENVDIEVCTDAQGGGYNVQRTAAGEWLLYTINVTQAGLYQFIPRTSSLSGGGKYHIEIDGIDVTGTIAAPITLGWQTWKSSALAPVALKAGLHAMKFCIDAPGFSINNVEIASAPTSVAQHDAVPSQYMLEQNFPNPFNPSTTVRFMLPQAQYVSLAVFDVMGNEVARLIDHTAMHAGVHTVEWNASGFTSGVYFYRITAGGFTETKRLILQK